MALAACRLAATDAGIAGGARLGLSVGSEYGDFRSGAEFFSGFLRRGPGGLSPMIFREEDLQPVSPQHQNVSPFRAEETTKAQ